MTFFMMDSRTLRDAPNGTLTDDVIMRGQEVNVLKEEQDWSQVQRKALSGWVLSTSIGQRTPTPPDPNIDKQQFFRQCWLEGLASEVIPHYLAAVAKLRSDIKGDIQDNQIGPYRFLQSQWDALRNVPALGLTDLRNDDVTQWDYQLLMFAATTARDLDALTNALGRPPSAHELYLASLVGAAAAKACIQPPDEPVDQNLTNAKDAELPEGGLSRPQIMARYASYLQDQGPPLVSVQSGVALDRIAKDLQAALDSTKDDMASAGTDILGATPAGDQLIEDAEKPGPGNPDPGNVTNPPSGNPTTNINHPGGPLGELIASKESGKAGYGAFNRGGAGDSFGKTIDFGKMTIAEIRSFQALPRGNANRLFAVGRYQMIPGTMKDAIEKLPLNPQGNFTPKVQEGAFRNFLVGIKRPLIKKFITASSPTNTDLFKAQMALAFEFASVGRPDTNQSQFGGVGHNRALISREQTATALQAEHQAYQANLSKGMTAQQAWTALSPGA